jgi:hypothetical protein
MNPNPERMHTMKNEPLTVNRMIEQLQELKREGHGSKQVVLGRGYWCQELWNRVFTIDQFPESEFSNREVDRVTIDAR